MFFGLKYIIAGAFHNNIQVWKTTRDIEILFLVEHLDSRSWTTSALPRLYKSIFKEESSLDIRDLDIKQDFSRREKFVAHLFSVHHAKGWFTSLEDKVEVEVCLFNKKQNSSQLKLIEVAEKNDENYNKYFRDSLRRLKMFPTPDFFERTQIVLKDTPIFDRTSDPYKRHLRYYKAIVKDELDTKKAKELYYDLRLKLKV